MARAFLPPNPLLSHNKFRIPQALMPSTIELMLSPFAPASLFAFCLSHLIIAILLLSSSGLAKSSPPPTECSVCEDLIAENLAEEEGDCKEPDDKDPVHKDDELKKRVEEFIEKMNLWKAEREMQRPPSSLTVPEGESTPRQVVSRQDSVKGVVDSCCS